MVPHKLMMEVIMEKSLTYFLALSSVLVLGTFLGMANQFVKSFKENQRKAQLVSIQPLSGQPT